VARAYANTPIGLNFIGIGIPEDKLGHVFEEFSQAEESTTRNYGGTGLGLPISRRFCRMMDGDITVESEPEGGSTFTIRLPSRVDPMEAARASATVTGPQGPDASHPVLVIDDDANSRDLLQRTLESDGHAVVTASGGEEGLELARRVVPSLITLDVMMPVMDGFEFMERLREHETAGDVPVIVLTAKDLTPEEERFLEAHTRSVIRKGPHDREALLSFIRRSAAGASKPASS